MNRCSGDAAPGTTAPTSSPSSTNPRCRESREARHLPACEKYEHAPLDARARERATSREMNQSSANNEEMSCRGRRLRVGGLGRTTGAVAAGRALDAVCADALVTDAYAAFVVQRANTSARLSRDVAWRPDDRRSPTAAASRALYVGLSTRQVVGLGLARQPSSGR